MKDKLYGWLYRQAWLPMLPEPWNRKVYAWHFRKIASTPVSRETRGRVPVCAACGKRMVKVDPDGCIDCPDGCEDAFPDWRD